MFVDLDRPVTALKLGVVYAKYEIAKRLWFHYPLTYTLVSMIYTMCREGVILECKRL
jgi:hypothetical protein